jgi:hypothetical protein
VLARGSTSPCYFNYPQRANEADFASFTLK